MNFFSWLFIKNRIIAIRYLMVDKTVPKRKKLLVIFGLVYLFMPLDLIPAFLFPFAWMDDLVLWIFIIYNLKDYLDKYWLGDKVNDLDKKYKNKKIIDNVDFSIDEKDEKGINNKGDKKNPDSESKED